MMAKVGPGPSSIATRSGPGLSRHARRSPRHRRSLGSPIRFCTFAGLDAASQGAPYVSFVHPSRAAAIGVAISLSITGCKGRRSGRHARRRAATRRGPDPDAGPDAFPVDANAGCEACCPRTTCRARTTGSADDTWPACISDDNAYHTFNASISTIARVAAFEEIRALLFTGSAPSPQDFIEARTQYLLANGLESRVARREDEHYPPVLDGGGLPVACQILTLEEQRANADRCVGPAKIAPVISAAFTVGQDGASTDPQRRLAAAQIEGALLWFLYISSHKEAVTCTAVQADCDSHYAYYTGGDPRELGKGLSRYIRALDGEAHDRVWDGVLAVRCWRDLDNPTGVADQSRHARPRGRSGRPRALARPVADRPRQDHRDGEQRAGRGQGRAVGPGPCPRAGAAARGHGARRGRGGAARRRARAQLGDRGQHDADLRVAARAFFPCP